MKSWLVSRAIVFAASLALVSGVPRPAVAQIPDTDGDGFIDTVEIGLGSDPFNPLSTPEHIAVWITCFDGLDNDGNGLVDQVDPKCQPSAPATGTFPGAGTDAFDSQIHLTGYPFEVAPAVTCPIDFTGRGPVVVQRSGAMSGFPPIPPTCAPDIPPSPMSTSFIDTEMTAMQITGTATLLPGSVCNPGVLPVDVPGVTVFEDPFFPSFGGVRSDEPFPPEPAESYFDLHFKVDVPGFGTFEPDPVCPTNPSIPSLPPYQQCDSACYAVAGLPHLHCPKAPLDHFKCYRARFPKFERREVTLVDQFGEIQTVVLKPRLFCNPVSKNGEPIFDECAHLKCYNIAKRPIAPGPQSLPSDPPIQGNFLRNTPRVAQIHNQFGAETMGIRRRRMICLPTGKEPHAFPQPSNFDQPNFDHFTCYSGLTIPRFTPRPVTLVDQFGTDETTVTKPELLCNPTSKNGEPIQDPEAHLRCYRIKPKKTEVSVVATNQFGEEQIQIRKSRLLCVPSAKFEGTTSTTVTVTTTTSTSTTTTTVPTSCCQFLVSSPGGGFLDACLDAVEPDATLKCALLGGIILPGVCDPATETCQPPPVGPNDWCCQCPVPAPPFPHPDFCFEGNFPHDLSKCQPPCTLFPATACGPITETCGGSPSGAFLDAADS